MTVNVIVIVSVSVGVSVDVDVGLGCEAGEWRDGVAGHLLSLYLPIYTPGT